MTFNTSFQYFFSPACWLFYLLVTIVMLTPLPLQAQEILNASNIDWVPWDQLSPELQSRVPDACCGLYLEPPQPDNPEDPDTLVVEGGSGEFDQKSGVLRIERRIEALLDNLQGVGDRAVYDSNQERLELDGNVQVRQPGLLIVGSEASLDRQERISTLNQASYLLHQERLRGTADIIVYTDSNGVVTIDNGVLTRCEPGDNSWIIRGQRIELNRDSGRGTARHVTLRVGNIPVLYTPYLSFPLNDERTSGFLAPVFGSTRSGGSAFAVPYYFNLAPNYDATVTPGIFTDRGVQIGLEQRFLGRRSQHEINFSYLPDDKQFDPDTAEIPGSDSPPEEDRWLIGINQSARFSNNWISGIDYTEVSDEDYFQDLGNTGLAITTRSFLYQTAQLRYLGDNWQFNTSALGYQVIDPSVSELNQPYSRLPSVSLAGNFSIGNHLEYGLVSEYIAFDRDIETSGLSPEQLDNGVLVTGQRFTLEPGVTWRWNAPGAFFQSSAKYRYADYSLKDQAVGAPDDPSRGILVGTLDSGLIFERQLEATGLLQTLEPRLFYLYSEYEDQSDIPIFDSSSMTFSYNQLFREDRFSGQDRVGDSNQITAAISTRLLDDSGREKAHASIGQIHYLEDRRVTLENIPGEAERKATSSITGDLSWQFSDNWRAYSYLEWNTRENALDVGNFQFRYQSDINHILNIGYRFRDMPDAVAVNGFDRRINQSDISAIWPVNENWGLIGRWNYDHANKRNLETIAGFRYSNCCWQVNVIAREWIDNDALFFGQIEKNRGIFLQFELSGFGSVLGGNVANILSNGIAGYRQREYAQ